MIATEVKGPVPIKNVALFMAMTTRVIERDPHLPGMCVCSGPSGYGKSYASIFTQNKTGAIRVEVGDSWTRRTFLLAVLKEAGAEIPKNRRGEIVRMAAAELAARAIEALGDDPKKPLIVDEADKLVDKGMIEIVRELHEFSGAPIVLIGEEKLPAKLVAVERVHNRVLDWMQAQACDLDDARVLAKAFAPKVTIADDLLELIRAQSQGRARRIVVNLARVAEHARNKGMKAVDRAAWGGLGFYTGEPPAVRGVDAYVRHARAA